MKYREAEISCGWRLRNIKAEAEIGPPAFDSRKIGREEVFFGLKGEIDGGRFALDAWNKGAQAVVVTEEWVQTLPAEARIVIVNDALKALTDLGRAVRSKFTGKVLGITGSCGKTSAKELISQVLSQKYRVLKNPASFNNHIGVPYTLARLDKDKFDMAVIEMGANHPGEIAGLCQIAAPTAGLITMVGRAHLEGFSDLKGVAKAKGELFRGLTGAKTAFVNFDDAFVTGQSSCIQARIGYGFAFPAEGQGFARIYQGIKTEDGFKVLNEDFYFPQPDYMKIHALSAAAIGHFWGVETYKIREALGSFPGVKGRMQRYEKDGVVFYDDTYNANPTSLNAALSFIAGLPGGRKIAVLGDMKELGSFSLEEHQRVLENADNLGFFRVLTLGENFLQAGSKENCRTAEEAAERLKSILKAGDTVLFKGSRAMQVEKVLNYFISDRN